MAVTTASSTTVTVEAPTREELVQIFASDGELFDDYLIFGHIDVRRDELTGEWLMLLSVKKTRQ